MKRILLTLLFLITLYGGVGNAQVGFFQRDDCTTLSPVEGKTFCINSIAGTLEAGTVYVYRNSTWNKLFDEAGNLTATGEIDFSQATVTGLVVSEEDTPDDIYARAKTATILNSRANAACFGDGTNAVCIFADALTGARIEPNEDADIADRVMVGKKRGYYSVTNDDWIFRTDDVTGKIDVAKGLVSGFSLPIARDTALLDTDDFNNILRIPFDQTITQVCAITDTGTSTINIQRNDGSAANILSSNLTAATTEACTTTFVSGENILSTGHYINFVMVTAAASGTPTKVTVSVKTERN